MFARDIAMQLRKRGHAVDGASEHGEWRRLPDRALFNLTQTEHRALVTNNVHHFPAIDREFREINRLHYGLILTSDRRFRRHVRGAIGPSVRALDAFLRTQPDE